MQLRSHKNTDSTSSEHLESEHLDDQARPRATEPGRLARAVTTLRRQWLLFAVAGLVVAVSSMSMPAWAAPVTAPLNQTVPPATPTPPFDQSAPTPTPVPDAGDDEADAEDEDADDDADDPGDGGDSGDSGDTGGENVDPNSVPFQMPQSEPDQGEGAAAQTAQTAQTNVEPGVELTAAVSVGTLNVREGPGTGFPVIGLFNLNQVVTVEARNQENTWWYVCCLPNTETRGWVSAPLLQSNFDRNQSAQLIPLFGETAEQQEAEAAQPTAVPTPATVAASLPISFTVSHSPAFVWQGKTFDINFTVTNPNNAALRNLEISDELPAGLRYVEGWGEGAPTVTEQVTDAGGVLVRIRWPVIPADAIVNAGITVTVDPGLPNGAVLDNLAAVRAANGAYTTGGVVIGMPPAALPDFQ